MERRRLHAVPRRTRAANSMAYLRAARAIHARMPGRCRTETVMSNDTVTKVFGGSPLAVLGRLILVSVLVGVILSALGLDPWNIVQSVERLIRDVWNMGFDAVRWMWRYFLLGAVIVIPIWILMRLVNAPRGR